MKNSLLISLLLLAVSGCRTSSLMFVDPPGPPEYKLGWQDGCDTSASADGSFAYKMMFGFKKRPEMAANDQYKQGWNEGFSYCSRAQAAADKPSGWPELGF